jgi:hypothetical protein
MPPLLGPKEGGHICFYQVHKAWICLTINCFLHTSNLFVIFHLFILVLDSHLGCFIVNCCLHTWDVISVLNFVKSFLVLLLVSLRPVWYPTLCCYYALEPVPPLHLPSQVLNLILVVLILLNCFISSRVLFCFCFFIDSSFSFFLALPSSI